MTDEVLTYLNCRKCFATKPGNQSMLEYSRISVGRTDFGLLIKCVRHQEQIVHLEYDWRELDKKVNPHCHNCNCEKCQK